MLQIGERKFPASAIEDQGRIDCAVVGRLFDQRLLERFDTPVYEFGATR
jgi:hypothetical protein